MHTILSCFGPILRGWAPHLCPCILNLQVLQLPEAPGIRTLEAFLDLGWSSFSGTRAGILGSLFSSLKLILCAR